MDSYANQPASIPVLAFVMFLLLGLVAFGYSLATHPLASLWDMPGIGIMCGTLGGAALALHESLSNGECRPRMTQQDAIFLCIRGLLGATFGFVALAILPSIQQQVIIIQGISSPSVWGLGIAAGLVSNPGALIRLITKQGP